jgi:hypothetical protein
MSATFALPLETGASAVRVPFEALLPAAPRSGAHAAVVRIVDVRGVPTPMPVEIGVVNDRLAEIRAGSLRPGMAVVVPGAP